MIDSTNPSVQGVTSTLEEAARRRADLYQAILGLEQAASRPAVAREEEWVTGVIEALDDLEGEILDHIEITERHDGLFGGQAVAWNESNRRYLPRISFERTQWVTEPGSEARTTG